jgi:hypothetical protein
MRESGSIDKKEEKSSPLEPGKGPIYIVGRRTKPARECRP